MTDLYLFRNDLRLEDNPGLAAHADADALLCVFILEPARPWCNTTGLGRQRERFLWESLRALQTQLRRAGQDLLVVTGDMLPNLQSLARRFGIRRIGLSRSPGSYEAKMVDQLSQKLDIPIALHGGNTLYEEQQIRTRMPKIPIHYTPFREQLVGVSSRHATGSAALAPPPPGFSAPRVEAPTTRPHPAFIARGGHNEAVQRLHAWMFRERAVDHYKQTRNSLEGLYFSSGLSPWLANGSLSVRSVADALLRYENTHGASESTEHLRRELLWREFFQWRAYADGDKLFHRYGIRGRRQLHTFEPRLFAQWCAGTTEFPLVNALMHQLVETGWLSNRGRQIVASCLVNELGVDWRFGAAFFEKHLLDYDVASNYGNWQYIAGVGTDPRGGRHFNLDKQAAQFDPDGEFTARWRGYQTMLPRHAVDAADWPLEQPPGGRR